MYAQRLRERGREKERKKKRERERVGKREQERGQKRERDLMFKEWGSLMMITLFLSVRNAFYFSHGWRLWEREKESEREG